MKLLRLFAMLISFSFHSCSYEWKFMNLLYDSLFCLCIRALMSENLWICCMTLFFAFAFVLLWVKNYKFVVWLFFRLCIRALMSEKLCNCCMTLFLAFAFVLLWVKNYAIVVWLFFFAFAFVLLWVKNYAFVVWLCFLTTDYCLSCTCNKGYKPHYCALGGAGIYLS